MAFNKKEYDQKYAKENYYRVALQVPKDWKEPMQAKAAEEGLSTNEWIRRAIHEKLSDNSGGG